MSATIPGDVFFHILSFLSEAVILTSTAGVCKTWLSRCYQNKLWRSRCEERWGPGRTLVGSEAKTSWEWRKDYKNLKSWSRKKHIQVLRDHSDEVLYTCFSHNGKYMVTMSRDGTAIVYDVDLAQLKRPDHPQDDACIFAIREIVELHAGYIGNFCTFSDDDAYLLLQCSSELMNQGLVHVFDVGRGIILKKIVTDPGDMFCSWFPGCYVFNTSWIEQENGDTNQDIIPWYVDADSLNVYPLRFLSNRIKFGQLTTWAHWLLMVPSGTNRENICVYPCDVCDVQTDDAARPPARAPTADQINISSDFVVDHDHIGSAVTPRDVVDGSPPAFPAISIRGPTALLGRANCLRCQPKGGCFMVYDAGTQCNFLRVRAIPELPATARISCRSNNTGNVQSDECQTSAQTTSEFWAKDSDMANFPDTRDRVTMGDLSAQRYSKSYASESKQSSDISGDDSDVMNGVDYCLGGTPRDSSNPPNELDEQISQEGVFQEDLVDCSDSCNHHSRAHITNLPTPSDIASSTANISRPSSVRKPPERQIDVGGMVVGVKCTPDHQFLLVNVRPFAGIVNALEDALPESGMTTDVEIDPELQFENPRRILKKIVLKVYRLSDLKLMCTYTGCKAFTSCEAPFWIFPSCGGGVDPAGYEPVFEQSSALNPQYSSSSSPLPCQPMPARYSCIASGAEDGRVHLWSTRYGNLINLTAYPLRSPVHALCASARLRVNVGGTQFTVLDNQTLCPFYSKKGRHAVRTLRGSQRRRHSPDLPGRGHFGQ